MSVRYIALPQAQEQITQRIKYGRELVRQSSPGNVVDESSLTWEEFHRWQNYNRTWLKTYLGDEVCEEYEAIQRGFWSGRNSMAISDAISYVIPQEIAVLESVLERLSLLLPESAAQSLIGRASNEAPIFIVHGSDTLRAESVARTVTLSTGRKTIILRDEPNSGRTIIEKFEQHAAEVSYAIIVLTPDDKGSRADETGTAPRARQNVIFEMGYFYGLLGRARVSVLLRPGVEKPSDMDGIAYILFDDNRAWKTELLRDLKHAGFDIDQ
jgi:predicted nucleotide-binding protein